MPGERFDASRVITANVSISGGSGLTEVTR
jgi:hypothetical protein